MRRLIIGISTAILLAGCNTFEGISTLMNFNDHPIVAKAHEGGATKQDMLAIQAPKRVLPARDGHTECLDYALENKGKKKDFYVGVTDTGRVGAFGFITCDKATKAGYLDVKTALR